NGEGLQHQDGHTLLMASTNPACLAYDPAYAYETAVIVREGLRRMIDDGEDVFYYLTLYNENYVMPPMPEGVEEGIVKGIYRFREAPGERKFKAQILGSGSIMGAALEAQNMLAKDHDVAADVWSVKSYQHLRADALQTERWNRLHPEEAARQPYVSKVLEQAEGPVVAVSDSMKAVPDQVSRWIGSRFVPLGTDGFGRSDHREALRRFFEIDPEHVVVATLAALAQAGDVKPEAVTEAIKKYGIDPESAPPNTV
ncbi:MAG TPA: pyruvate dehydrogenase (acetyl-transferring), homodimeric type, partial [Actinomycetota bacterium]|nr:pyruvate dehydrogenase (acetyl-transferring), homodimeric type [Actinomycetota bacterium]